MSFIRSSPLRLLLIAFPISAISFTSQAEVTAATTSRPEPAEAIQATSAFNLSTLGGVSYADDPLCQSLVRSLRQQLTVTKATLCERPITTSPQPGIQRPVWRKLTRQEMMSRIGLLKSIDSVWATAHSAESQRLNIRTDRLADLISAGDISVDETYFDLSPLNRNSGDSLLLRYQGNGRDTERFYDDWVKGRMTTWHLICGHQIIVKITPTGDIDPAFMPLTAFGANFVRYGDQVSVDSLSEWPSDSLTIVVDGNTCPIQYRTRPVPLRKKGTP